MWINPMTQMVYTKRKKSHYLYFNFLRLGTERLGQLAKYVRGDEGDPSAVLAHHPQHGSPCTGHIDGVDELGHLGDDVLVLLLLGLQQLLYLQHALCHNRLQEK